MLQNETRERLIKAFNETHDARAVAESFSVNISTVYRLVGQMRTTGSIQTQTHLRGRKPALTKEDVQNINRLVREKPDITLKEIIQALDLHVSDETVRKAILKLGYVYKNRAFQQAP